MTKKKFNTFVRKNVYLYVSLIILFGSIVFWSIIGANAQSSNPSQLINSLLFTNRSTFEHALIPAQQTFLIKWPLFYLIHLLGTTKSSLILFTVIIDVITVALFILILSKIEKRPKYLAIICLAIASCLLLIPALPAPGILQPVNMAMLATRNIEYIVYIYAIILLIKSPKFKSWRFWYSVALMSVVIASDKFFFIVSIIGAIVALIYYGMVDKVVHDNLVTKWLSITIGGLFGSIILLWLISTSTITKFTSQVLGSYALSTNLHDISRGIFFTFSSLLTNFGANPGATTTAIHLYPKNLIHNYFSLGIIGYSANLAVLLLGLFLVFKVTRHSLITKTKGKQHSRNKYTKVATILCWTSLASVIVFVLTKHNYSIDSNYLAVTFFAIFISIAVYVKDKNISDRAIFIIGGILLLAIISGISPAWNNYRDDQVALSSYTLENSNIVSALKQHQVNVLLGNYNQDITIKQLYQKQQGIMPLNNCITPSQSLSSSLWRPSLEANSFAYILNLSSNGEIPQTCSLNQIKNVYGSANSATLITGNISHPKVLLLFFDHGLNKRVINSSPSNSTPVPVVTTAPIPFANLPSISCSVPTLMTIVAHQDDDLLFMNPDLSKKIESGDCVRAIYLTAGDDGKGPYYWLGRQLGSEAAYSIMLGSNKIWLERNIELANNEYITIANPAGNPNISLIFFHLPDGNLNGQGFAASHFESLASLYSGKIHSIQSVDNQSSYTSTTLVNALTSLMHYYQPSEIWTQSGFFTTGDHSDHITTGKFATQAYNTYETQQYQGLVTIPIDYFVGYPIKNMPANVFGADLALKTKVFYAYAKNDANICNSVGCYNIATYSGYFPHEYTEPY